MQFAPVPVDHESLSFVRHIKKIFLTFSELPAHCFYYCSRCVQILTHRYKH